MEWTEELVLRRMHGWGNKLVTGAAWDAIGVVVLGSCHECWLYLGRLKVVVMNGK